MFQKIECTELPYNMSNELTNHWALVSAVKDNVVNTMTIGWGNIGRIWGKNAATVYIRQSRYTKEFVDDADYFTISLFDDYRKELGYLGRVSGRDENKIEKVNFHVEMIEDQPAFQEAKAVIICKKWYQDDIKIEDMPEDVIKAYYSGNDEGDYHTMYIAEVVSCYINK